MRTVCKASQRKICQEMASPFPVTGSKVTLRQPAIKAGTGEVLPDGPENLHEGVHPRIMRPKKIILCVDDNEQELSVLKFMLATNGYRVLSATSGPAAIDIFAENPVDLVVTDCVMPQMNGCQLVERLKQIAGHVPMILLGDPQRMAGVMHAADALLSKKNCSPQELLERVKVMSAHKRGPRKGAQRVVAPMVELAMAS
jgi:two-component system, OmpR family, response regulator CpxR